MRSTLFIKIKTPATAKPEAISYGVSTMLGWAPIFTEPVRIQPLALMSIYLTQYFTIQGWRLALQLQTIELCYIIHKGT